MSSSSSSASATAPARLSDDPESQLLLARIAASLEVVADQPLSVATPLLRQYLRSVAEFSSRCADLARHCADIERQALAADLETRTPQLTRPPPRLVRSPTLLDVAALMRQTHLQRTSSSTPPLASETQELPS